MQYVQRVDGATSADHVRLFMSLDTAALSRKLTAAVNDQFTLGDLLGVGGSASVFRAHDRVLSRDVAIKVIDPVLAGSSSLETLFLHEAQTVASLEHPNIVPLYSAHSRDGLLYLVMRLLDGESLTKRLSAGVLAPVEASRIASDVANALAAAHARGIVHRDIKPENVLLDRTGRAFVTDFGIALVTSRAGVHADGGTLGTPGYMSPEQLLGEEVDGRTDIYATGVLLFEMLAGRPPFVANSLAATLAQHMTQTPPLLSALRPEVPTALAAVAEQCLRKSAQERPTAEQLATLLTAASTSAALRSPAQVKRAKRRRRLAIVGSLVAAGAAMFAVLVMVIVRIIQQVFGDGGEPALYAFYESVPSAVVADARTTGALQPQERVAFAFVQAGSDTRNILLMTDSMIIRRSVAGTRRYPVVGTRFDIARNIDLFSPSSGVATVRQASGVVDTLFTNVSGTEALRLGSAFATLEAARQRKRATP